MEKENDNKAAINDPQMEGLAVVNINDLRKQKEESSLNTKKPASVNDIPVESIKNWLIVGFAIGLVFALLGIVYRHLLYVSLLGPILAISVWGVRRFSNKFSKYDDDIFKS